MQQGFVFWILLQNNLVFFSLTELYNSGGFSTNSHISLVMRVFSGINILMNCGGMAAAYFVFEATN